MQTPPPTTTAAATPTTTTTTAVKTGQLTRNETMKFIVEPWPFGAFHVCRSCCCTLGQAAK